MATDEQIERVRTMTFWDSALDIKEIQSLKAVLSDHAKLDAYKRLAPLLQRACDDQRRCETMQGLVPWYEEAKAALAECEG